MCIGFELTCVDAYAIEAYPQKAVGAIKLALGLIAKNMAGIGTTN